MGGAAAEPRLTLRPLQVLRDALRVYREHWAGLIVGAMAVFVPLSLLDATLSHHEAESSTLSVAEKVAEQALDLFGDVFYAGLVAAAVIAWRHGVHRERAIDIAKALPWATIVVLDLVVTVGTGILLLALVVPGAVFYVFTALAPSVAKIEHIGVRAALRRSARMVRGNAWRVFGVLVLIEVVSSAIEEALQLTFHTFALDASASIVADVVSAPVYGLATVLMAFALGARADHAHGA